MNSIEIACTQCGTKNRIPADKQHLGPKCGKCKTDISLGNAAVPVELDDAAFPGFIRMTAKPVMVDFFSPTCGPCRMLAPVIDSVAKKFFGRIIIAKLDTSSNGRIPAQFQVRGVPTLIFFKDGQQVDQVTGAMPEETLTQKLNQFA